MNRQPRQPRLLTIGNPKTLKGEKKGYLTAVLHLAPHTSGGAGVNVCPLADGCESPCLNTAGRGGILRKGEQTNAIQEARKARTKRLFADRKGFVAQLQYEVETHIRRARKRGFEPAFRLNGTSDLDWHGLAPGVVKLIQDSKAPMYDYTKVPNRIKRTVDGTYHLTFSLSAANDETAARWLADGGNVAVVFRTKQLPDTFTIAGITRPVVNGDESDLRFLDEKNVIIGLYAKGRAKHDTSGFVRG